VSECTHSTVPAVTEPIDPLRVICCLDQLDDPGSRAFTAGTGDWPLRGFVVRRGSDAFAYVNRCPHAGHPLNWQPDQFLSSTRTLILCCSHGAQFMIDSGRCVAGPCVGSELTRIAVKIVGGKVLLEEDPQTLAARHA
jgi:nitrite reductase/ring-hydroxylating ferredoxin subunit